ncbi:unnamed protein product [Arctia plantaginis]|uniref:Fatty acyl-CoA reductase n=1 Tax=Arctia plantaginis TaxID=874455 RepID=A0A8S1BAZ7_ARCPL|nr:unnamed protein product [Arctia plantaginis]
MASLSSSQAVLDFLARCFSEKLLYSCEGIANIFVLIRDKKGVTSEQRLKQVIEKPVFSRIKTARPDALNKLIPIGGDINLPNLGLTSTDEEKLLEKVSVVIHMAATIKFHEKLNISVNSNVKGTEYVLNLCHRMKRLKAFIHVSTAYCNTDQHLLEEKVYPPRVKLDEVLRYIEQPDQDEEVIKKRFLKSLPNTYTFTKGLAENYVLDHHGNIPTVIVRPSIVSPSLREPLEGWTDNWFGATGMIVATVKGANRVIFGHPQNVLDLIPVDYVVNAIIVAASQCLETLAVYNCCTSSCNPLTLEMLLNCVKETAITIGFHDNSFPTVIFTNKKWMLLILTFLLQIIPAYVADLILWVVGKTPKYVKLQSQAIAVRSLINFFTSNSWEMKVDNVKTLYASLSHADQREFPCDPSDINWNKYNNNFVLGIKKYLMN